MSSKTTETIPHSSPLITHTSLLIAHCSQLTSIYIYHMRSLIFLILLSFAFFACGGDSGTSPNKDSNVSEETGNDKVTSSSSDKSSSSSKKDSSVSSSSANKVSSSSGKGNVDASSSSRKAESSSSTERVGMSHSEVVFDTTRFCTPGYAYCDRDLGADSIHAGAYKQFTDTRNNRKYYYLTINGKDTSNNAASITVMAENLNVGEMIDGAMDQSSDLKIERYCYDNDSANCEEYGGLYQWAEAMQLPSECNTKSCEIQENHQGICPEGWHIVHDGEWAYLQQKSGSSASYLGSKVAGFGSNGSGLSILPTGSWERYPNGSLVFRDIKKPHTYRKNQKFMDEYIFQ